MRTAPPSGPNKYAVRGPNGKLLLEWDGSVARDSIYAGDRLIAWVDSTGVFDVTTDTIGSVRMVTNASQTVVERHDFLPFGEEWNPPASISPVKFAGKERDAETGFDYFGARYNRGLSGRFTSVDPVYTWRENLVDPERWNRYVYVRNNPLRYVDPDGRAIETAWDAVNVGMGVASLVANVAAGNVGKAVVDAIGIAVDAAATATPFVPGGAGTAIRAARAGDKAVDLLRGADAAVDVARTAGAARTQVQLNRAAGNAFRDEMASLLQKSGRQVQTEVSKKTPFGTRVIDIEVSQGGKVLGGIETKTGKSRYTPSQRAKDLWLEKVQGYPVEVVRDR